MPIEFIGLLTILAMLILIFLRIPIGISMFLPSIIAIYFLRDSQNVFGLIESIVWHQSYNYVLTTIPMFILMGQLIYYSGISEDLFAMFRTLLGRVRGGLAISTIGASALFSSASGSSVATTATTGVIAAKEMLNSNYNKSFAGGTIVAGGTLGALIPPSTLFIIYGMLTEQSIGQLFIAGIVPGVLLTLLFMLTIWISVLFKKDIAPGGRAYSLKEKLLSMRSTLPIIILFIIVIGGMYVGLFTPTESAGVGACGAAVIALLKKKLTFENTKQALFTTLTTTGFIFAIIIGAFILNYLLTITRIPSFLENFLNNTSLSPIAIFACIILMYILLGAVMDPMSLIVVTIPVVLPVIVALQFDLIWFGVIVVLVAEMGLITPPIGLNTFVLNGVVKELRIEQIFKGAFLFLIPILILIFLLYAFPEIALFLPQTMR